MSDDNRIIYKGNETFCFNCKYCRITGDEYQVEECIHSNTRKVKMSLLHGYYYIYPECIDKNKGYDCPDYEDKWYIKLIRFIIGANR